VANLGKLAKQLRREATASPKKAAALGLLVLVALWFWGPLVWGWITPDKSDTAVAADPVADPALPVMIDAAQTTGNTEKETESPRHSWQELAQWMDDDRMASATSVPIGTRDPFVPPRAEVAVTVEEDKPDEEKSDLTLEDLGLALSGTIIGPHRRVAQINGRSYTEGETVKVTIDRQPIEFVLVEVHRTYVVLRRRTTHYMLKIPTANEPGKIELLGSLN